MKYQAVNTQTLRKMLGDQCSPIGPCRYHGTEPWYVVGPNIEGDVAHLATCYNMSDAVKLAASWNDKE